MVVHEAATAGEAVLRVAASHLWTRGVISAGLAPADPPACPHPALTRPACRPPSGMTAPAKPEASGPWPGSSPCTSPAVPTAWLRRTWMASSRWSSILLCCGVDRGEGPGPPGPHTAANSIAARREPQATATALATHHQLWTLFPTN